MGKKKEKGFIIRNSLTFHLAIEVFRSYCTQQTITAQKILPFFFILILQKNAWRNKKKQKNFALLLHYIKPTHFFSF